MLKLLMCMLLTIRCDWGLVTTKELDAAMEKAISNGWTPPPAPQLDRAILAYPIIWFLPHSSP